MSTPPDNNSEETDEDRITRLSKAVIKELSDCTLEDALTVICGIGGHLIANLAKGDMRQVPVHTKSVRERMRVNAVTRMRHHRAAKKGAVKCDE